MSVHGHMDTDRPERYAKQLSGHWAHKGTVTSLEDGGVRLELDRGGVTTLRPVPGRLDIEANSPAFGEVVAAHLVRFGHRETLTVVWDS